jgi:hypothetical protein
MAADESDGKDEPLANVRIAAAKLSSDLDRARQPPIV